MAPVDESAVPPPHKARAAFKEAMESWDESAADAAVAGLARSAGLNETFELFFRYGARDFRSIGHKAIFVANSYRTLQAIGYQHAEPILRSLAYALLNHRGQPNPASNDLDADRPWRQNQKLAPTIRSDYQRGKVDAAHVPAMLEALRTESPEQVCAGAVALINAGAPAQAIWDAVFDASGELLMRQPGIVALHAVTTTNALNFIYRASANDQTRRLALLQNLAFLPMFREAMSGRGKVGSTRIDQIEPIEPKAGGREALAEIFDDVSGQRSTAASKVLGYLKAGGDAAGLINTARRLIFLKGTDAHDYKFSSAVLENYFHVSAGWRDRFLAASVFKLRGAKDRDNSLAQRTLDALS